MSKIGPELPLLLRALHDESANEYDGSLVNVLQEMIGIPSVNPDQQGTIPSSQCGEAAFAQHLEKEFLSLRPFFEVDIEQEEVLDGRPNIYIAIKAGANISSPKWLAMDVHMDTVGVEGMTPYPPYSGVFEDGKVHGRGSCDTKASLAVALWLLRQMKSHNQALKHNLLLVGSVGEETGGDGAEAFVKWLKRRDLVLDELLVTEPTGCDVVHGHKGQLCFEVKIAGRACHSSIPQAGKNALLAASGVIGVVDNLHKKFQQDASSFPFLGPPTVCPTVLNAGSGYNIIPDSAVLVTDYRVAAEQDCQRAADELAQEVETSLRQSAHCITSSHRFLEKKPSFWQDPDVDFVHRMRTFADSKVHTVGFSTNASYYDRSVCKACVVMGPGFIEQAHAVDEFVEFDQLCLFSHVLARWWGVNEKQLDSPALQSAL